jgi:fibronectin-binding autotransporter adhesin
VREFSFVGAGNARVDRRRLKLSTILSGGALTAALLVPAAVQAADPLVRLQPVSAAQGPVNTAPPRGPTSEPAPQDLTIHAPAGFTPMISGGPPFYLQGGALMADVLADLPVPRQPAPGAQLQLAASTTLPGGQLTGPAPQDLTIRPPERLTATVGGGVATYSYSSAVATTANNTPGVNANYAGSVAITAGNITTSGAYSAGVQAVAGGQATVKVGDVTTSGAYSNGLTVTGGGKVAITAGNISTSGTYATGIQATAGGDLNITAASVSATGSGIVAQSGAAGTNYHAPTGGNIAITAGNVAAAATGISAHTYGAGAITITAGSVSAGSRGIYAKSGSYGGNYYPAGKTITRAPIGGNISITAGDVSAAGIGVYAVSYGARAAVNVTVNGNISTYALLGDGVLASSGGTVSVTTTGAITEVSALTLGFAGGIIAQGGGDVTVNSQGLIKTYGDRAYGILGSSQTGNVSITSNAIDLYTGRSFGIAATAPLGKATVVAGNITSSYSYFTGIAVEAGSADITLSGNLQATGAASSGIEATTYSGNLTIHNNGSITLGDLSGAGIRANAQGNLVIDGQGSVTTGDRAGGYGVIAVSQAGSVSVTQGAIASNNYGVLAVAESAGGPYGKAANGISINVGSVTTTGTGKVGTGIMAVDYNGASTVSINAGSVTTIGDGAVGINAVAYGAGSTGSGQVTITGGSISTRGKLAYGVELLGTGHDSVTLTSVTTTGLNAIGLDIQTNPLTPGGGSINANIGSISTAGDNATGIFAYSVGTITAQIGSVTTTGNQAIGILALNAGGATTINAGSVSTSGGANSSAILAEGGAGVSVTATGAISTQGGSSVGVEGLAGAGPVDLTLSGPVSTQGVGSSAVIGQSYGGPVNLTLTGAVSTNGLGSAGVVAESQTDTVDVQTGKVSTAGVQAPGLAIYAFGNSATVTASSISTSGLRSPGAMIEGLTGVTFTGGQVTTGGDLANGLIIRSGSYAAIGDATVNVTSIATSGNQSAGIDALVVGPTLTGPSPGSTLSINVGSITTAGADSVGISALDSYGAINIKASNIATQGAESAGILAFGGSTINIQAGSISTGAADAIYANGLAGSGAITVGVTGKVASSGANGIVAIGASGATDITVSSSGAVSGAGDAIQVQTGTGKVTVSNAGVITGGTGFAIDVTGGAPTTTTTPTTPTTSARIDLTAASSTSIDNTGTIVGAVNLAAGSSATVTNAGTFIATKASDFGGDALFVNTGVLQVGPGAGTVSFLGLATFENAGGLIDLRKAPVGEVFDLSGDYVASGDARLGLDVSGSLADKLVIQGTATGATSILLGVSPLNATLLAKPMALVQAGAGSTGTFTLSNVNVGLIHYALQAVPGAAGVSFDLTASAGAPVYGTLKLEEAAQTVWQQSADAWSEHLAAMRGDAMSGGTAPTPGIWVQAFDSNSDRSETVATGFGGMSVAYHQTDAGGQVGADLVRTPTQLGTVGWGLTAGYSSSNIDALGGTLRSDIETVNVGGYGVLDSGPYFANGLVKFDRHQINTTDGMVGASSNFDGDSYGARFEFGRHFGEGVWAFEPTIGLTYVSTSLDPVSLDRQTVAFDDEDGFSGKIGGRFYAHGTFGGTAMVFYAGAAAVDDFTGDQKATFLSGGTSQLITASGTGTYGQAVIGVSARAARDVTLFLEGDGEFGGDHSGEGVRFGARF